jgi:hypothetical protein
MGKKEAAALPWLVCCVLEVGKKLGRWPRRAKGNHLSALRASVVKQNEPPAALETLRTRTRRIKANEKAILKMLDIMRLQGQAETAISQA